MANSIPVRCRRTVLSSDGVQRIRYASLDILERTGVIVKSKRAQKLLVDAGCDLDEKSAVVRFPPSLVEECARARKRSVTFFGRTAKHDARLDGDHVHICSDGNGTMALDFETRRRRTSTKEDVAKAAFVSDALRGHGVNWPSVTSQDVPMGTRHIHDLHASLENTEKHITLATNTTEWEVEDVLAIGAAAAGSSEEFARKPFISSIHTSSSPLVIDAEGMDAGFAAADGGMPICFYVMPGPGATGPVTLAGSVAVGVAETLAGNTIIQLHRPGTAFVFSCGMAVLDMMASTRAGGGPEHGLTSAAYTQMAHHFGFPALAGGFVTTSKEPDEQAAYEKFASSVTPILAGADLIAGIGLLEDCRTVWLEQMVIDDEISRIISRMAEGIDVSDDSLALDVIDKVGPGKDFLGVRHTLERFKTEHFMPTLSDRSSWDSWEAKGSKTLVQRAGDEVRRIMNEHSVAPPRGEVEDTVKALIEKRAR
ncbi:MAG: trimethylamine methyltransferase family protein [Methanobacteriota archaeon]|nr:MAG: trimethylamine methyltransferase family protein [Euryarchaeota archaeon]